MLAVVCFRSREVNVGEMRSGTEPSVPTPSDDMTFYEHSVASEGPVVDVEGQMGKSLADTAAPSWGGTGPPIVGGPGFQELAATAVATTAAGAALGVPSSASSMVSSLFRGARDQVTSKGMLDVYAQIDHLRPYFDVETDEVRQRLIWSLHPRKGSMLLKHYDLYAPLMLAFTLVAVLIMGMKSAHIALAGDSTLIGSALGVSASNAPLHGPSATPRRLDTPSSRSDRALKHTCRLSHRFCRLPSHSGG